MPLGAAMTLVSASRIDSGDSETTGFITVPEEELLLDELEELELEELLDELELELLLDELEVVDELDVVDDELVVLVLDVVPPLPPLPPEPPPPVSAVLWPSRRKLRAPHAGTADTKAKRIGERRSAWRDVIGTS